MSLPKTQKCGETIKFKAYVLSKAEVATQIQSAAVRQKYILSVTSSCNFIKEDKSDFLCQTSQFLKHSVSQTNRSMG